MEITNITGLEKPLLRLIEVIAKGVGAVSAPYLVRRRADAEAYNVEKIAKAIKAVGEQYQLPVTYESGEISIWQKPDDGTLILDNNTLEDRAKNRLDFIERKRQANIEAITSSAAEVLVAADHAPTEHPSDDWIARFFREAKDVSLRQMQELWGRILAGEILQPGSFSLRTLDLVRNLSNTEASLIEKCLNIAFKVEDRSGDVILIRGKAFGDTLDTFTMSEIIQLDDLGVINSDGLVMTKKLERKEYKFAISNNNLLLVFEAKNESSEVILSFYRVSNIGRELVNLVQNQLDISYISSLGNKLKSQGTTISIGAISERTDGNIKYDIVEIIS